MNVFSRGVRGAFRNGVRTVGIVGMLGLSIGLSLAMLLAHQAIGQKIASVQQDVGNTITVAPAGIRGFEGGGNPLTADQLGKIKAVPHVTSVDETLSDRLNSSDTSLQSAIDAGNFGRRQFRIENNLNSSGDSGPTTMSFGGGGTFQPPVIVLGATTPLASVTTASGNALKVTNGHSFDGTKDASVALVGSSLASKNNLTIGSTFTAYSGTSFTVAGIFDAGNTFSNNQVIMPLPTVQRLSGQSGAVTGASVHIDSSVNLDSATNAISSLLGSNADVTNDATAAKTTLSSLQNIQHVSLFSLIGAAATAAVIILLTMVMIVRERKREIGVLKAIGASNARVMLQFMVESLTLTVLAAVIGITIGSLAATPVTKLLASSSTNSTTPTVQGVDQGGPGGTAMFVGPRGGGFRARFANNSVAQGVKKLRANVNGSIVAYGLGGALLIAVVGSTAAAGLITKIRPSEVMRAD
ncbi:MAG TPA: FtsX-like permease family protein [Candidatus Saccharimonadales bacterium]|nr:FtsX-like permease family protein [Candidatus Saccharimonadales bacterium]